MSELDLQKFSALRKLLKKNKIDGLIVSDYTDLKYLLGPVFTKPGEAIALVHKKGVYATARNLYEAPVRAIFKGKITLDGCDNNREALIIKAAKKHNLKNVVFDVYKEKYHIGQTYIKAGFKEGGSFIDTLRVTKTPAEIALMKHAAKISYGALLHAKKILRPGLTEKQLADAIDDYMRAKGASNTSFETTAAFGPGGSNPHYKPGHIKLKKNMAVLLDFGCVYKGYCSDITRSFWYGDKAPDEFKYILKTVIAAHDEVIKKARLGMSGAQIDAIARNYIDKAGYGIYFTHRTGHGIGMYVHEAADISPINHGKILENYCFSVEPGIYLEGKYGVRHEDCFYMTKKGIKQLV